MSSLAALVLATPLFGFALTPPVYAAPSLSHGATMQIAEASEPTQDAAEEATDEQLARRLATRRSMADWMTGLGFASLGALTVTNVLGAVHFHDHFGFSGSFQDTPCARGVAVMQEYCEGTFWPYTIASGSAAALYVTTAMLGWFMPDPLQASEQPNAWGERIRIHRSLRWVTSGLLIAQALLGAFISLSDEWFDMDPQNDFEALQALSATRLGLGVAAMASLTAQGSIMLF